MRIFYHLDTYCDCLNKMAQKAREGVLGVVGKFLSEPELSSAMSAAANAVKIATVHAETLKGLREVKAEDAESQELHLMYSILIPGYSNEESIMCVELATLLYPVVVVAKATNTELLGLLSEYMPVMQADTVIFIAYHAAFKIDDASIYMTCCAIVLDAVEFDTSRDGHFILEDSAKVWATRNPDFVVDVDTPEELHSSCDLSVANFNDHGVQESKTEDTQA